MAKILDCKVIRDETIRLLKGLKNRGTVVEFIRVGDDKASEVYVNNKNKLLNSVGIPTKTTVIPKHLQYESVVKECVANSCNYVLVQLPLPKEINERKVMNLISNGWDIDCQNDNNLGAMISGYDKEKILPCTTWGILRVIREYYSKDNPLTRPEKLGELNMDCVRGKTVTVIGRSNIVGKPTILSLINCGATVIECNSKTGEKEIRGYTEKSDIVVLATGRAKLFNNTYFSNSKEQLIIDVGINVVGNTENGKRKIVGDLNENYLPDNVTYTPVPGGMGILTVLGLLINYFKLEDSRWRK